MVDNFYSRTENTTDTWITPPYIVKALGKFDLDPAAPENISSEFRHTPKWYTEKDNGLIQLWEGRVWLNPPYGNTITPFMKKMAEHGNGIALVFTRVETKWFKEYVWDIADAVFFFDKRIKFLDANGNKAGSPSSPSCLIAYGKENVKSIFDSGLGGTMVKRIIDNI